MVHVSSCGQYRTTLIALEVLEEINYDPDIRDNEFFFSEDSEKVDGDNDNTSFVKF